jgi:hypothetical protein
VVEGFELAPQQRVKPEDVNDHSYGSDEPGEHQ